MSNIFNVVLKMSITSTLVILAVLALRLLLKKQAKALSYALWALVFIKLICPIAFETKTALVPPPLQNLVTSEEFTLRELTKDIGTVGGQHAPAQNIMDSTQSDSLIASDTHGNPINLKVMASYLWFVVVCFLMAQSFLKLKMLSDKVKHSHYETENIYTSDAIDTPFILGLVHPKIYLPTQLAISDRKYIIKHEQIHIKRLDYIIKPLFLAIAILHWFNPLVWLSFSLMSRDMEMSCDEQVLNHFGCGIKKDYSLQLLAFAAQKKPCYSGTVLFGENAPESRIKNVLHYKKPTLLVVAVFVAVISFVGIGAFTRQKPASVAPAPSENAVTAQSPAPSENSVTAQSPSINESTVTAKTLLYPTAADTTITRGYGGTYPAHDGIDLAGELGTDIYAAKSGTVTVSQLSETGDGNYIIIDHGDRMSTLYAHCSTLLVAEGDEVKSGQKIAEMGSSGNSTGNHLHFELTKDGVSVDPQKFF
ncbi:MAG: M23/M56 family metallopeptidase [Oscillospiraceae bacterium]